MKVVNGLGATEELVVGVLAGGVVAGAGITTTEVVTICSDAPLDGEMPFCHIVLPSVT